MVAVFPGIIDGEADGPIVARAHLGPVPFVRSLRSLLGPEAIDAELAGAFT